ncbi:ABC transporter ATP-binding protein [Comamonas faecalis]|uniref:ABC transporter ATP-binding protein n=1 Tax=Comamonas faecalis TaxID=1387849 RepID=A0ABP7QD81_9BURK
MTAAAPPLLEVHGLARRYGTQAVFENVDFTLDKGQSLAITGDSGVGKSTLLNCLAGLDGWQAGRIVHQGVDLAQLGDTARAVWRRAHLGFVFQAFHVLPQLTVAQNIALPLMLLGRSDGARVRTMIDAVGLQGLDARMPQQLSGGQLQRVAIARALVHAPPLLLADEPTGNLDPTTAALILDLLLAQTRQQDAALVLVTHAPQAAARCDRTLQLTTRGMCPASSVSGQA